METNPSGTRLVIETAKTAENIQDTRGHLHHLQWYILTFALVLNDALTVSLAFVLAYFVRFELSIKVFRLETIPTVWFYQKLMFILIPVWLTIFALKGLYDRKNLLGGTSEYERVFSATTVGTVIVIAAGFLDPGFILARGWLLLAWGLSFLLTALGRFLLRRVVYSLRLRGFFQFFALIIGANDEGLSLAEQLVQWRTSGLHIVGFVDKKIPTGTILSNHLRVLGTIEHLDDIIDRYGIEELILASSAITSRENVMEIFQKYGVSSSVNVRISSGLYEIITTGLTVREFAYVPLVGINKVRLTGLDRLLKFVLDYSLTLVLLILAFPFLVLIALAVKLDSPGPVIYRRRVMGLNGRQFDAYKFRTMYVNGDEILSNFPRKKQELANNHKLKVDPRITRLGRYLRKTSVDELPQLINILKRDMSLVGPRIITPGEVENYHRWDINLLTVRPGLTGLWQVRGRSDISYNERVRLDMYYIRNWNIWLDLQLILQTIPVVIKGSGAY